TVPTDDTHCAITGVPEIVAIIDEESDPMETEESGDEGDMDSDEDWKPVKDFLLARALRKKADDEIEDEEEHGDECSPFVPKHSQLCTECGIFFNKRRPHTCEHKMKPYSCNICGKRCVSEVALNCHSRIHNENYEHRCKYCHVTFKTKVDKITHEQTHLIQGKPYKCPDCSETFATNKERRVHLEDHRGPRQLKCHICGIEFLWPLSLQRHLAVHTGEKPFKCSVCQRGFNQASHLKSHMRLHTGERPYKCQHCDKCFNHNVSLKSHVQRYHSASSGHERKKGIKSKTVSDTVDAKEGGNKRGTDSGLDKVEEEDDKEEEVQEETKDMPKKKHRSTGRPIGRPKSYESGNVVVAVQEEGQCSNNESRKIQNLNTVRFSDEELEPSDSDTFFDSAEEEEERSKKAIKNTASVTVWETEPGVGTKVPPPVPLRPAGTEGSLRMCSVVGCGSWRRSAQRFRLPEDPERRLEWVQFLFTVNKQRFKESSWTDITICSEHFTEDCFVQLTPTHSGGAGKIQVRLKPGAVPSLSLQAESDEPGAHLERDTCVESVKKEDDCQLKTCDGPTSNSEESTAARGSPVPTGIFTSADTSDIFISISGQMQPKNVKNDLIREKATLLQMKEKFIVKEKRLLQLFSSKCPLCGSDPKMEKVTCGMLVILNQQCLQCEYRNQWKSQVNASEDQHLTGGTEVTPEGQQTVPTDDTHRTITGDTEIVAIISRENDPNDETEDSSDQGNMDSDEDWKPMKYMLTRRKRTKEEDEQDDSYSSLTVEYRRLCTECGIFFNNLRPHTCEHKVKPYPCNTCGKRCVSEAALNSHSRSHNQKYEYRCKYCRGTFKTKVDKITHEQTHLIQGKPYKCPDCSETFATNKERRVHLEDHGGPRQLKCHICGIEFLWPLALQRHILVHTGEKPFKCSVCQRGFNQTSHLKSHMRLHTGERPYKCQHCDKCFNHNVSLRSHVQRYHSASSGHERKKGIKSKTVSDAVDAEDGGNKRGTDSGLDKVEEEDDKEEEVEKERKDLPKYKPRSTGRPIGRPKSNVVVAVQEKGQCRKSKSTKVKKLEGVRCIDEETEDEPSDGDKFFDSAEEKRSKKAIKNTARSRGRLKNSDSDSDFDPKERKKKRDSFQNSVPLRPAGTEGSLRMCSVVGCGSWRRSAQRFRLPEDPERRLEWVQFLFTVNKQRFKESSWTDITICSEHFTEDCFVNPSPPGTVQLKPGVVPSLSVRSEPDEPDPHQEPEETTEVSFQCDQVKMCDSPSSYCEESELSSVAPQGSPVPSDNSEAFMYDYGQMLQNIANIDMIREKAALLQMKGKYVVNEKRLLQLFSSKCPLCGSNVKMEKVTYGVLLVLNQQCLQCEYRNQWKSQVNASEDQHLTGGTEVTPESQQTVPTDDTHSTITGVSEIVAVIDEESDPSEEIEESGDESDMDSDEDWKPVKELSPGNELHDDSDEGSEYENNDYTPFAPKNSQLCTECGVFFNKQRPHTCEHKMKPYSCNICGKRCVSEVALNCHSRIHNENYEHRCKYCHVTFKTKVDKITHEQTHLIQGKPYKCPDCSETFATNKERRVHLEDHRGPRQLKCHICGIEFLWPLSLQRHLAVHTGEKPFKCSVCQRGFNQASHLKSHMRLHTGERPYKYTCQHCDKCFNHNVSLSLRVTSSVTTQPALDMNGRRGLKAASGCARWSDAVRGVAVRSGSGYRRIRRGDWSGSSSCSRSTDSGFKESSWTDITICSEHFTEDCFVNPSPPGTVQLKPGVVPSLSVRSEPDEPDPHLERATCVEPDDDQCDDLYTCNSPIVFSEKSGFRTSPQSSGVSVSYLPASGSDQRQQKVTTDLNKEKAALLQMKGKFVVNESCLLQLFRRKCPLCGCKLQMEKVVYGVLLVLNQQCLQCEYRNQWKSQVNASVPTAADQRLTGEVTPESQQEMPTDNKPSSRVFSEIVTFSDEESDPSDEGEEGDEGGASSDGEWNPSEDFSLAEELTKASEEESEDEGDKEEDFDPPGGLKINELCTECGSFFNILKSHTCEHKIKPYSCNICGKRCVTEMSLKAHSKIHDETYEHPCKFCHITFKTRVDKLKHEQIHQDRKDPYKCPDCPETFATSKERGVHLANHRTPREFKCGVCGIDFKDVHHLRRHSVVHTGLKPFKCSVCQRGFNQTSHLKSHMRLHTGERPFKCQHCDKSFNHNVSLKSHVQRYHSDNSGHKWKKGKETAKGVSDAEDNGDKKGTDSESDGAEGEQDTKEEVQKDVLKSKKRSTGRPRGRPKRNAAHCSVLSVGKKGRRTKTQTAKSKVQKLKKTGSSYEESEDEQSDSDTSFDSAQEEEEKEEEEEEDEEEKETAGKSTGRSRGRPKNDSDTEFNPEEAKKKRYSSPSGGKSSERRGRPKENLML
ncbi:hypothetical protein L3Q82_021486, partial [Scortum barcoo]